jgi:hypothetical protein
MSKHTPGPWKIFEGWGADSRRPVIIDSVPDVEGKFVGNCICYLASTNPDMDANARLIAAAPEMLQVLKSAKLFTSGFTGAKSDRLNIEIDLLVSKVEGK